MLSPQTIPLGAFISPSAPKLNEPPLNIFMRETFIGGAVSQEFESEEQTAEEMSEKSAPICLTSEHHAITSPTNDAR